MAERKHKQYGDAETYERKLAAVMERLKVKEYEYNWDRHGCWVQFRLKGELYRFDHSVKNAQAHNVKLSYGSDAFAQVVLGLEDIARITERGIYELSTWVSGMRYLPPVVEVPSFLRFLGFAEIPATQEEIRERYRTLSKQMHPDTGGSSGDFQALQRATEQALAYMGEKS